MKNAEKLDETGSGAASNTSSFISRAFSLLRKAGLKSGLKVAGGSVGVIAVSAAALPVFGAMMIIGLGIGCIVVIGSAIHAYTLLRKHGIVQPVEVILEKGNQPASDRGGPAAAAAKTAASGDHYVLWDCKGLIPVFVSEPTSEQVVSFDASASSAGSTEMFNVANNTRAALVSDSHLLAVRIRILSGTAQGRTGWVSRGSLLPAAKVAA